MSELVVDRSSWKAECNIDSGQFSTPEPGLDIHVDFKFHF